jgi:hypothetical protein
MDANQEAIWTAMAELGHLENSTSRDEAIRIAIAQMCAGALFLEAHAGKQRADQVVRELYTAQLRDRLVHVRCDPSPGFSETR